MNWPFCCLNGQKWPLLRKPIINGKKAASKFEKEVDTIQREIAKVEDNLDIAMSSTKETADKLELADKEAIDAELQVGALKRRLALLEEEAARNKAKLQVSNEKHYALFLQYSRIQTLFLGKHWKM